MQQDEALSARDLDVPSDTVVTVERLKELVGLLPKIGREFTREALEEMPGAPPKSVIPRVVGYLKYLGILNEHRIRADKEAGREPIQKFSLTEVGRELYYFAESGRDEQFRGRWQTHIRGHPVFQVVYRLKFRDHPTLTLHELQDLVYEGKGRSVTAQFARNGAHFLATLYADAGLADYDRQAGKLVLASDGGEPPRPDRPLDSVGPEPSAAPTPPALPGPKPVTEQSSFAGPRADTEYEEYRSKEIIIRLVPTAFNISKARGFLKLIEVDSGAADGGGEEKSDGR